MADTFYGWTPPDVDAALFNDSNCGIAAQWLSAVINSRYNDTDLSDPPLMATYQYITALVPSGGELPTFGQVAQWLAVGSDNSTLYEAMVQFPYGYCPAEMCEKLVWDGDGDLAGVGVLVVYYLAAMFSTLYFVLISSDQFEPFRALEYHHRRWNWIVAAFHETVQAFLDTGLIFSIAMLIASVYRHGSSRMHPDKSHSIYQLTNATYIGIFSIFPPVLLQIVSPNRRRRRIRAFLWLVAIVLAVVLTALYYSLETNADKVLNLLDRESAVSDFIWELNCEPLDLRQGLDDALITALVILIVNFLPWAYHIFVPRTVRHSIRDRSCIGRLNTTKPGRHGRDWWKYVLTIVRTTDGAICCSMMWALLGLFTKYRSVVLSVMGPENANTEWSFAQVFALATWVPVAIDLCTIYIYGAKEGLEGKVSENFKVVANDNNDRKSSNGGGGGGIDGPNDVDYSNLDPYQIVPAQTKSAATSHYDAVSNDTQMQYVGSGGQFADGQYNNGVFSSNDNSNNSNNSNNTVPYGGNMSYDTTHYGAGGAGNVVGQFAPQQYAPQQFAPQYDQSMTKEPMEEVQLMGQYVQPMQAGQPVQQVQQVHQVQQVQPEQYRSNTVSSVQTHGSGQSTQPVTYEYMPQDPAAMHGGVQQ
ncbi:hypothetical protein SPBR_00370 [Sporothrix brasiliensis 5110]|uniref:C6 zinc finger domain containing protein n=1 Tax=Sporothrix brasiliensis 5110 TaxID=1398154 RepID=A0A0C2IMG3_9PEZI|nr:uncharacterized protein SPBR_00370 [Sporothrix brasiliensis 5110]KIH90226.1 hypothetical protein SPBR_00370 [Sporothrix brasiliensis 5110]